MTKPSAHYAWIQMRRENFPHRVRTHLDGARIPSQRAPHTADASLSLHRELIHNEKYSPLPLPKISYKKKKEKNFYFPT